MEQGKKLSMALVTAMCCCYEASAAAASMRQYLQAIDQNTELNEQLQCGFLGYRWIRPSMRREYVEKANQHVQVRFFAQKEWAEKQTPEALAEEVSELEQRIEQCQSNKRAPNLPARGKSINTFIPMGWQELSQQAYESQFKQLDIKPAFSPVEKTLSIDLNGDNRQDMVALIGRKTVSNIGFDDFRLLVLLADDDGYSLMYNVKAGLHDLPIEGDTLSRAKFVIEPSDDNTSFKLMNMVAYDHNRSDQSTIFHFGYQDQKIKIKQYKYRSMYFSYDSSPEQKVLSHTYDFENKRLKTYNSQITDVSNCSNYASPQDAYECPAPIEKTEVLSLPDNIHLELSDLEDFGPIDWEKDYKITTKPLPIQQLDENSP